MLGMTPLTRNNLLAVCVFIDLFAVSLIVPLLPLRYKELGMSPVMIGMVGSVYSVSQIFGGIILGFLGDRLPDRRQVLLLSFAGAATSYALVGLASSVWLLVVSRVVVGCVKQTMTASKAMAATWSDDDGRTAAMARLSSASTAAWVTGSAMTGFVHSWHPAAPSVLAVGLYAADAALVLAALPPCANTSKDAGKEAAAAAASGQATASGSPEAAAAAAADDDDEKQRPKAAASAPSASAASLVASSLKRCGSAFSSLSVLGSSKASMGRVLLVKVLYGVALRASYQMQDVWEMERFGLKTGQLGWLRAAKSLATVLLQAAATGPAVHALGSEKRAFAAALVLAIAGFGCQLMATDVVFYACSAVPLSLVASLLGGTALDALLTTLVPPSQLGKALASVDVLNAGVGVVAPLLGGAVIEFCGLSAKPVVSGVSYALVLAAALAYMPNKKAAKAKVP